VNLVCVSKFILSCCRSLCWLVSCDAGLSGPFQTSAKTHCHLFTHLLPLSVPCWNSHSCLNSHLEHISIEYHIWTFVYMAVFPHQVYLKSFMHKVDSEQLDIQHWLFPLSHCNHLFCLWCVQSAVMVLWSSSSLHSPFGLLPFIYFTNSCVIFYSWFIFSCYFS